MFSHRPRPRSRPARAAVCVHRKTAAAPAHHPPSPKRARAWLVVVRVALIDVALAYVLLRGMITGELTVEVALDGLRDALTALRG